MPVQVIVELLSGVIDQVTVFQFKEDAQQYYDNKGGPALEGSDDKREVKWFQDVTIRCVPARTAE